MASPGVGRQGHVGIGKETARGSNVNPNYMVQARMTGGDKSAYVNSEGPDGTLNQYSDSRLDQLMADPGYNGDLYLDPLGLELLSTLGNVVTTLDVGGVTGLNQHDFTLDNTTNEHQSLTVHDQTGPDSLQYPLGMVSSLGVTMALQAFIQRTITFMSRVSETVTPLSGSALDVDNSQKFLAFQTRASVGADETAAIAAPNLGVISFDCNINKNPKVAYVGGRTDRNPEYITAGETSVDANMGIHYLNDDEKAKYLAGTKQAIRILMSNNASAAAERSVAWLFESVTLPEWERGNEDNELLTQQIKIMPFKDNSATNARLTKITIRNNVAAY